MLVPEWQRNLKSQGRGLNLNYFLGLKNQTIKDFTLLAFNHGVENLSNKISSFKLAFLLILIFSFSIFSLASCTSFLLEFSNSFTLTLSKDFEYI